MPFNTLGQLGAPLALNYDDTPVPAEVQRSWKQMLEAQSPANNRMPVYGAPNLDRNAMRPNDLMLYNTGPRPAELASLGQRYQDYPAATFDQRFGPYQPPTATDQDRDMLRRLLEEQMLRNTPEGIVPGSQLVDPLGHRGERSPAGYYLLRGI